MSQHTWRAEEARWRRALDRADYSSETIETYIREINQYFDYCTEQELVSADIDSADLYVEHRQWSRSVHSARHAARAIKAYGKYLANEYEEGDPFRKLKLPKEPEITAPHAAAATDEDIEKLLSTCDQSTFIGARDYALITLLAETGLRRSEAVNLHMEDVDIDEQTINVKTGKTAAAKRLLYLPNEAQGALLRYMKKRDELIAKERRRHRSSAWLNNLEALSPEPFWISHKTECPAFKPNGLTQTLRKKGNAVGVDVRAHAMRRKHATDWLAAGGTENGLMANSGWKSNAMVQRYTRDNREKLAIDEARRLRDA